MMTFKEFYVDRSHFPYPGMIGEDVGVVYQRMADMAAEYMEYRVELKLKEIEKRLSK